MFEFEIKIPIRTHLKKMIAFYREIDPLIISVDKDHYSAIFYQAFERDKFIKNCFKGRIIYNDLIIIRFPMRVTQENRFNIEYKRLQYIDAQLRSIFDEKLFEYLNEHCYEKGDIKNHCIQFMQKYDISEEEITLDALVKSYQRYRTKTSVKDKINFRAKKNYHKPSYNKESTQTSLF